MSEFFHNIDFDYLLVDFDHKESTSIVDHIDLELTCDVCVGQLGSLHRQHSPTKEESINKNSSRASRTMLPMCGKFLDVDCVERLTAKS